jgi:hypothetical protein
MGKVRWCGDGPGAGYDQLVVSGSATLHGTLTVSLGTSFAPSSGDTFQILIFSSSVGAFATTIIDPALMNSPVYDPMDVTLVAN